MIDREHPCARGLTPNCFEAYPEWAKRAFAYRLMHALFPGRITRRLPRVLWEPLIGEEAEIPPDVILPPGTVVPPWSSWDLQWTPWFFLDFDWWVDPTDLFPPGWETGDPLPPGVEVDPEYVFPPGWTPDLPLPPGVVVDPGVTFPPGWTPEIPLPPGVTIDPIQVLPPGWNPRAGGPPPLMLRPTLPEEAKESGPLPPAYTQIWEPGPVHRNDQVAGLPEIMGFYFKLTRGDGAIAKDTGDVRGYITVYNSDEEKIYSATKTYIPAAGYWAIEIDEEDIDENGYFVRVNATNGIVTQYPYRYKEDDQWNEADLIPFGIYEETVPYWIVGGITSSPDKAFAYPDDAENQYDWAATYGAPEGYGTLTINLGSVRTGFYALIGNTVERFEVKRTVKSSIPYTVEYRVEPRTTFAAGTRWTFYVYDEVVYLGFDDDWSYKLISDGEEKVITDGVGSVVFSEKEPDIEGQEHVAGLEPVPPAEGYRFFALRKGPGLTVDADYE